MSETVKVTNSCLLVEVEGILHQAALPDWIMRALVRQAEALNGGVIPFGPPIESIRLDRDQDRERNGHPFKR
jgi:hypothetical protein